MGMDAKPISVEVWAATIPARNVTHLNAEDAARHIVNGVRLRDEYPPARQRGPNDPDRRVAAINLFVTANLCPCVHVDSTFQG